MRQMVVTCAKAPAEDQQGSWEGVQRPLGSLRVPGPRCSCGIQDIPVGFAIAARTEDLVPVGPH